MCIRDRGIIEPTATFSPCFGGPFLTLHPLRYAELLKEKMNNFKVPAYLVNTGWVGASAQSGAKRISLPLTRKMIHAILDGTIEESEFESDPYFGVKVPKSLDEIGEELLIPANAWKDKIEYDKIAKTLVRKFNENFSKYNIDDIDIILKFNLQFLPTRSQSSSVVILYFFHNLFQLLFKHFLPYRIIR